jgi:hypothetical protein
MYRDGKQEVEKLPRRNRKVSRKEPKGFQEGTERFPGRNRKVSRKEPKGFHEGTERFRFPGL